MNDISRQFKLTGISVLIVLLLLSCSTHQSTKAKSSGTIASMPIDWRDEIIYHVMPRSFYDSDGDLHGDLNGFVEKLDYLQELGVTTILFTPLYASEFYHNYFPTDYEKIDPEYGSKEDYLHFVRAVHKRGMKFLMDMETQYAQSGNKWFDDSYQNPSSEYSDFIYYNDSLNQLPEQIFMESGSPLYDFTAWPGDKYNIVILDLNNDRLRQWMVDFYAYWVDPNGDGNFEDGVDGFRIDHIMDDLDKKGIFTDLYSSFWNPIFLKCKSINPDILILGEQSHWSDYGDDMVARSGADAAFNFQLRFALAGEEDADDMFSDPVSKSVIMDPMRIHEVVSESVIRFKDGTYVVSFLENHDTYRWASVVNGNTGQIRIGAALYLLLPGIPSIYYGQELGLTGIKGDWGSDENDIPVREAFPWTTEPDNDGTAVFYKNTGECWNVSFHRTEAIRELALSVQLQDSESLWYHYQELIALRKKYPAFRQGSYTPVYLNDSRFMAFRRAHDGNELLVILNVLGENLRLIESDLSGWHAEPVAGEFQVEKNGALSLEPYQYVVLKN